MVKAILLLAVVVATVSAQQGIVAVSANTTATTTSTTNPPGNLNDTITGGGRPPVPEQNVPTDLTCPTSANTSSVFLTANTTHPESKYTSLLAWQEIVALQKVPQPPSGCNLNGVTENSLNISSICAATVTDGFIVISNFNVTLQCGATAAVQANFRINGTAGDDVTIRNFNVAPWYVRPGVVPAPAPGPVAAAPSPLVMPSPSPKPPPVCRDGNRPICQFMLASNNVCCNQTGIVTALPFADLIFTCSADAVDGLNPNCIVVDGPTRPTFQQLPGGVGYRMIYGNASNHYNGTVNIAVNQTGECALKINNGGCQINGQVFTQIPQVDNFTFAIQDPRAVQYYNWISNSSQLDFLGSTSWLVNGANQSGRGCRFEPNWRLPEYFTYNFANYTSNSTFGTTFNCNNSTGTTCTVVNAALNAQNNT